MSLNCGYQQAYCSSLKRYVSMDSAIFLKKRKVPECIEWPKIQSESGGVSYTNSGEKRFKNAIPSCVLLRNKFWNGVLAHSVTKITVCMGNNRGVITNREKLNNLKKIMSQSQFVHQTSHIGWPRPGGWQLTTWVKAQPPDSDTAPTGPTVVKGMESQPATGMCSRDTH
jgi:hypothetical protein